MPRITWYEPATSRACANTPASNGQSIALADFFDLADIVWFHLSVVDGDGYGLSFRLGEVMMGPMDSRQPIARRFQHLPDFGKSLFFGHSNSIPVVIPQSNRTVERTDRHTGAGSPAATARPAYPLGWRLPQRYRTPPLSHEKPRKSRASRGTEIVWVFGNRCRTIERLQNCNPRFFNEFRHLPMKRIGLIETHGDSRAKSSRSDVAMVAVGFNPWFGEHKTRFVA